MGRAFPGGAKRAISSETSEIVSSRSQWAEFICVRMCEITRFSPFTISCLLRFGDFAQYDAAGAWSASAGAFGKKRGYGNRRNPFPPSVPAGPWLAPTRRPPRGTSWPDADPVGIKVRVGVEIAPGLNLDAVLDGFKV